MAAALLVTAVSGVSAEPYLALRTGLLCGDCHVNRTGGGARLPMGTGYGSRDLPLTRVEDGDLFEGTVSERLRVGADLRAGYRADIRHGRADLGGFELSQASLYAVFDLLPGRLTLYADERVAPGGASNREAFALLRGRRAGAWVKAGRFFQPFGLRLQDDGAATRRFTGFNFDTSDTGLEIGVEPGRWSFALAATNGSAGGAEVNNGKQVSALGLYGGKRWRAGVSLSDNDLLVGARKVWGVFGGLRVGEPVVVLAEWDTIRDETPGTPDRDAQVTHLEVDWTARRGWTVRGWAGRYQPGSMGPGARLDQVGFAVDWTPLPGLQVRALHREGDGPPGVEGADDDQARVELHVYF